MLAIVSLSLTERNHLFFKIGNALCVPSLLMPSFFGKKLLLTFQLKKKELAVFLKSSSESLTLCAKNGDALNY